MWQRITLSLACACLAGAVHADFPETRPDDPGYIDQYGLKGHINRAQYPLATDAEGASGMSVNEAWADTANWGKASTGRADVLIAYIEGGINYNAGGQHEIIPKVYLNRAEIEASDAYAPEQFVDNLDDDPEWEVVVRTQMSDTTGPGIQVLTGTGHLLAYDNDGSLMPGWPTDMSGIAFFYGSAQEFITEGSNSPAAADIDGDGRHEIASAPVFSVNTYVFNGDGSRFRRYFALPGLKLDPAYPLVDVPATFTTSGAFGEFGGKLTYGQAGSTAVSVITGLLTAGIGLPIKNRQMAFFAESGVRRPGFDAKRHGLNFLGAPLFVDVTGDGAAEMVDGGDSSALHAYNAAGVQAPGFPKFTTGWNLWSPSAGDLDSDGDIELVAKYSRGLHLRLGHAR